MISRRVFLRLAAAAATIPACDTTLPPTPVRAPPGSFFTDAEWRALNALADVVLPPDQDAGAVWAGVVSYIDRQLCGPYQALQETYRYGLGAVDQTSQSNYGKVFADLQSHQQIELLHRLEESKAPSGAWKQLSSAEFFGYVVDHTMQGFYGDPRHGGNREGVSWKMLNLPYPPIRGRVRSDLSKPRSG